MPQAKADRFADDLQNGELEECSRPDLEPAPAAQAKGTGENDGQVCRKP